MVPPHGLCPSEAVFCGHSRQVKSLPVMVYSLLKLKERCRLVPRNIWEVQKVAAGRGRKNFSLCGTLINISLLAGFYLNMVIRWLLLR
jgi:hypothetical protein